jgi:Zn-dependent M32 family carboxypeptidase
VFQEALNRDEEKVNQTFVTSVFDEMDNKIDKLIPEISKKAILKGEEGITKHYSKK